MVLCLTEPAPAPAVKKPGSARNEPIDMRPPLTIGVSSMVDDMNVPVLHHSAVCR